MNNNHATSEGRTEMIHTTRIDIPPDMDGLMVAAAWAVLAGCLLGIAGFVAAAHAAIALGVLG